jgi:hypothetical protein
VAFINTLYNLYNLWPNGDEKVSGLRDGIAASTGNTRDCQFWSLV